MMLYDIRLSKTSKQTWSHVCNINIGTWCTTFRHHTSDSWMTKHSENCRMITNPPIGSFKEF